MQTRPDYGACYSHQYPRVLVERLNETDPTQPKFYSTVDIGYPSGPPPDTYSHRRPIIHHLDYAFTFLRFSPQHRALALDNLRSQACEKSSTEDIETLPELLQSLAEEPDFTWEFENFEYTSVKWEEEFVLNKASWTESLRGTASKYFHRLPEEDWEHHFFLSVVCELEALWEGEGQRFPEWRPLNFANPLVGTRQETAIKQWWGEAVEKDLDGVLLRQCQERVEARMYLPPQVQRSMSRLEMLERDLGKRGPLIRVQAPKWGDWIQLFQQWDPWFLGRWHSDSLDILRIRQV